MLSRYHWRSGPTLRYGGSDDRQAERERRPFSQLGLDLELAPVEAEDLRDQRQAEPRPPGGPGLRISATEESLAEVGQLLLGDAGAVVCHGDDGLFSHDPARDADVAGHWGVLHRVRQQVLQDPLEEHRIRFYRQGPSYLDGEVMARRERPQPRDQRFDDRLDVDVLGAHVQPSGFEA